MTADELAEAFGPGLKETVIVLYNGSLFFYGEFIMTQYDKPYKTLDELILLLSTERNLVIPDTEKAKTILKFIPYYDLINGYKEHFMDENDKFESGTTLDFLYMFHTFDRGFQNILFEFSVIIEDYYKNILSQVLSKHFGVDEKEYLAPEHYLSRKGSISRKQLLEHLNGILAHPLENPTKYYKNHHNHIPPWILLKNVTFSNAINLFVILTREAKTDLVNELLPIDVPVDQKIPILRYTLTLIRKFRNIIAHNLKFTTFSCKQYANNLNKKALRLLIPETLLKNDELNKQTILYGIYGYITLSLSIIPDASTKLLLVNKLTEYVVNRALQSNQNLSQTWYLLGQKYFLETNIPTNMIRRFPEYCRYLVKNAQH